jgi:hypothetical protein
MKIALSTDPTFSRRAARTGLLCLAALALPLAGCPSESTDGNGANEPFVIKSISLQGTTDAPATVVVDQQADKDGTADQSFEVSFTLDGRTGAASLPVDTGDAQTVVLEAKGSRASDGAVSRTRVTIGLGD